MTLLQSGGELLAPDLVPWIAAAVLALGAVTVLAAAVAQPGRRRAYLAVGVVTCCLLAAAHAAIALDALETVGLDPATIAAVARLAGYAIALGLVLGLLGRAAGLRRWPVVGLGAAAALHVAALAGWVLLEGQLAVGALVAAALLALAVAYGVAVAVRRAGPRARRLLVVRLAGLVGLVWTVAVLALGLSPLGAGVLDGYTATVLGAYLDVLFGTGVGALLVTAGDALDELTGATTPTSVADAVAAPAPGDDQRGVEPGVEDVTAADGVSPASSGDSPAGSGESPVGNGESPAGSDESPAGSGESPAGNDDSATAGDGGTVADPSENGDDGRAH